MLFRRSFGKDVVEKTNWEISPNAKGYLRKANSDKIRRYNKYFPFFLILVCGIALAIASVYPNQKLLENIKGCLILGATLTGFWILFGFYVRSNQMLYKKLELSKYSNDVLELTMDRNTPFEIRSVKLVTNIEGEAVVNVGSGLLTYTVFVPEEIYNKFLLNNSIAKKA
jgi:uncharacterized membrane protein